jgi:hypothetical protein
MLSLALAEIRNSGPATWHGSGRTTNEMSRGLQCGKFHKGVEPELGLTVVWQFSFTQTEA